MKEDVAFELPSTYLLGMKRLFLSLIPAPPGSTALLLHVHAPAMNGEMERCIQIFEEYTPTQEAIISHAPSVVHLGANRQVKLQIFKEKCLVNPQRSCQIHA
jgi:hypothetical protein